jgi:hypothetical protein
MGSLTKILVFSLVVALVLFQNCGNDASFTRDVVGSSSDSDVNAGLESNINDNLGTGDQEEDLSVIDEACRSLPLRTQRVTVDFPTPQQTCAFGAGDNLTELDGFFRARTEQSQNLGLPVGAVICSAAFDFNPQPFRYDDYFALLFNNKVIVAGYDFSDELTPVNFGLLNYDWLRLRGIRMDFGGPKEQVFCPQIPGAQSQCAFPGHDTQGTINLNLDDRYIQAVMSTGVPMNHSFTLVTFGDNDNGRDCLHQPVEFDVSVTYVIAN